MPALSPTMTEGNIAKWMVKEGDTFSPGDVLLEIETDKATMDVEAQDEGIMAKIIQKDGSKGVKIGERIAVLAEHGDDLSSLEIPSVEEPHGGSASETNAAAESTGDSETKSETHNSTSEESSSKPETKSNQPLPSEAHTRQYPLYPSVQMLLHQKGISNEEAKRITASGPNGRLLKGDVLAYLGEIESDYAAKQSKHIAKLGHLDLSNIKLAPPPKAAAKKKLAERQDAVPERDTEVTVPVSLSAVFEAQERLQESLGMTLPLATFIARASEIANERLPRPRVPPSADELFDAVLGLNTPRKDSRGNYTPRVVALGPVSVQAPLVKAMDIIDVLTRSPQPAPRRMHSGELGVGSFGADNIFSVSAKKGEERRARVYLERIKTVLESEPGRCVL